MLLLLGTLLQSITGHQAQQQQQPPHQLMLPQLQQLLWH
jgi:hypothetical protein